MGLPRGEYPIHQMILPSTKKKIKYRPYLVKEEKILLMASETNDEKQMISATKQVLKNCILEDEFDVNEMAIFDMQYAFVQLRAKSVGEIAELKIICTECQHENDYKFNFSDIKVSIPENLDFKIPMKSIDGGKGGVTMRFPSVGILDKFTKDEMSDGNNALEILMSCVKNIWTEQTVFDPHKETSEERISFIESLGHDDLKLIEEFTNKIPTISKKIEFDCNKCNAHNEREIGGMSDFFI